MKKEEIKELSIPELRAQIEAAEKAYRELKVTHAISPIDNPAKITKDRREIARLKTVLRQKEIEAAKAAAVAEV
ncbi:MAG: 50S ribosomal protein L29 [Bacteroidales bacterium]|nr:50S ribosomal protein L29 [Bacteroidales bacterium]